MSVIALTGGIGSGKSLVANYFFSLGAEDKPHKKTIPNPIIK